jgi:K+-transporting ATPase ATPase C chain
MKQLIIALRIYIGLTLVVGLGYTLAVTAVAQVLLPRQAHGSLVVIDGRARGSSLIGQAFDSPRYFHPRPSAVGYNTLPSGGSNLAVAGLRLRDSVEQRRTAFRQGNGLSDQVPVPVDMLFTSASGLDPHISPQAARLQIGRIAKQRNFSAAQKKTLAALVERSIEPPQLGFLGQRRINVFALNYALDQLR